MTKEEIRRRKNLIRAKKRAFQLQMYLVFAISMFTSLVIILMVATNKPASAADYLDKMYTSYEVQQGDTLYSIAKKNILGYEDINEYVAEVMFINHLPSHRIIEGSNLIIPYYADRRSYEE